MGSRKTGIRIFLVGLSDASQWGFALEMLIFITALILSFGSVFYQHDSGIPLKEVRKRVTPLKLLGLGGLLDSFTNDDEEVLSQHKRNSLPFVAKLFLLVIQEVTKVNVEQLEAHEGEESRESMGGAVW